ncbi:MAG: ribonuclease E/G, partial [Myxococcales bacterium]
MSNILVINASGQETRVALIEQGTISEYYLERKNEKGIVGNVYKGKVVRVLPGMQAAFVDIGLDKAAFLYVADIVADPSFPGFSEEIEIQAGATEGDPLDIDDVAEPGIENGAPTPPAGSSPVVEEGAAPGNPTPDSVPRVAVQAVDVSTIPTPIEVTPMAVIPVPEPGRDAPAEHEGNREAPPTSEPWPREAAPAAEASHDEHGEAGAHPGEPILELTAEEALEEGEEEGDDEDDDLDEGDAAHAAAEAAIAAESSSAAPDATASGAAPETAGAPGGAAEGKIGVSPEQRPALRERRGRRRGGRGRRRGAPAKPAEERPKPEPRQQQGRDRQENKRLGNGHGHGRRAQIQDLLKEGDEVLVQVVKDPIGTKGARITCHISLPGRHLVFMPTVDHVGISRRIENEKERRRLRELVDRYRPPGTGFIVRTVAENEPEEKLTADIKFLLGLWNEVGKKRENLRAPALVHPDLDLVLRSVRDLFSDDVSKLVIDDRAEYERVRTFVADVAPELRDVVELYSGDEPIFDEFGIEQELQKAQNRKVWLKSGG